MRLVTRWLGALEVRQIERFGRSVLSVLFRTRVLVLHTTGRRSGRPRSTPLAFVRATDLTKPSNRRKADSDTDDGLRHETPSALLIVGGAAGKRATPDWVANIRARLSTTDTVEVTVDRHRHTMCITELTGPEREAVWPALTKIWPRIVRYERRSGREVPVFRLESLDSRRR